MKIEAKNLQDALLVAASQLECSVLDLEYEVIQHHKDGFLGLFQRNAIIEARCKKRKFDKKYPKKRDFGEKYSSNSRYNDRYDEPYKPQRKDSPSYEKSYESKSYENKAFDERVNRYDDYESKFSSTQRDENPQEKAEKLRKSYESYDKSYEKKSFNGVKGYKISTDDEPIKPTPRANESAKAFRPSAESIKQEPQGFENDKIFGINHKQFASDEPDEEQTPSAPLPKSKYVVKDDEIFNSFHKESVPNPKLYIDEIRIQLDKLIKAGEFGVKITELSVYDKDSIYIKLEGEDAALLIGKEAYRYKALSYLLHNWINSRYNLLIRLEIADFLRNQSQSMDFYLQGIIERVEATGRAQTKPLDGVLVKLALEKLRERFPNKYVGIRQNDDDEKFVIINDFFKKDE